MTKHTLALLIVTIATLYSSLTTTAARVLEPFILTTIVDDQFASDTHWYSIHVRNGKYLYVDTESRQICCSYITAPTAERQEFLWAFTGNSSTGYRIHNYTTGATMSLGSAEVNNSTYPVMSTNAAYNTFSLTANSEGFSLCPFGSTNVYLNDKGSNGIMGYWASAEGATSNGSRMVFTEVEMNGGEGGGGNVDPQPEPDALNAFVTLLQTAQQAYDANSSYEYDALIRKASQLYSPYSQNELGTTVDGGDISTLIDSSPQTYWHTYWQGGNVSPGTHYIRCAAPEGVDAFEGEYIVSITRRASYNDHPTQFVVYGSNNPDAYNAWDEVATLSFDYNGQGTTETASLSVRAPYKYLRFNCTATTNSRGYFHMAEFQIYGMGMLSPSCPNALYPEAAAHFADALAQAQATLDAYYSGAGTITQDDVTTLRQALSDYRRDIPILVTSLTITPTEFTTYDVGSTLTIKSTVLPANASNNTLRWTSSDTSVATVNDQGIVTTTGGGECTITATTTDGSYLEAYCHVIVYADIDYSALCINEIQAGNIDQYLDPSFNYGGWIELYNSSSVPIPLEGFYVVGSNHNGVEEVPFRFIFPLDNRYDYGFVPAHGYKNIWFDHYAVYDNKPITEHAAYKQVYWKLDKDGGRVALLAPDGQNVVCELTYPAMPPRSSYARTTDGGDTWAWHACGTPESSNNYGDYLSTPQRLPEPEVSTESQVYSGFTSFSVTIPEGATLRYTTNGTTPTESSNESKDGNFTVSYDTQTYRFRLFQDGYLPSPVVTRSFINQQKASLPILVVTTDDANLNDYQYGIFSSSSNGRLGNGASSPTNRNMDWERPVNVEYFDLTAEGDAYRNVINQEADFSVAGGWTRNSASNIPFKIKAAEQYDGHKYLHYPIFKSKPYNKNRTLLIRNEIDLSDPGIQEIVQRSGLYLDLQDWEPAILYLNGKNKGYIPLREPNNKHFALANYGIDTDEVDVFEIHCDSNYVQSTGTREAFDRWFSLAEQCAHDEAAYQELCNLVDIEEYMNYMAVELYLGNNDWPWNNFKGFRAKDGKFHLVLMDVGHRICAISNPFDNLREYVTKHYRPHLGPTPTAQIFFNMVANERFRRHFIDAFCLVAYSVYDPEFVSEVAYDMSNKVRAYSYMSPSVLTSKLNASRQSLMLTELIQRFPEGKLSPVDQFTINLRTNVEGARLQLNGLPIPRQRFNGTLFAPATLSALAPEGYVFDGWRNASGTTLCADADWTIEEGYYQDFGSIYATFTPCVTSPNTPPVRINEVSASNDMYVNELWDRKDWVELYNTTDQPIDVAGMYLSDNVTKPTKWAIPATDSSILGASAANTIIPAHGTLVIWCDKEPAGQQLHASFKLTNDDGCVVTLQAADGTWTDRFEYDTHGGRESVGRYPDGGEHVYLFTRPTIDAPNHYGYFGFKSILPASIGQVALLIDRALKGETTLSDIQETVGHLLRGE